MFLLSKAFFIFIDQLDFIIEVIYIIPPISFWAIASPANKIFNGKLFLSFDCLFIKQVVDFKRFKIISITVNKHRGELMVAELLKKVFGWLIYGLKLCY